MRLDLYEHETAETVSDVGGTGETTDVTAGAAEETAASGAADVAAEAAAPTEAPAFDFDSPEVQSRLADMSQRQVEEYLHRLASQVEQPQAEQPGFDFSSLDPFDDNFAPNLVEGLSQVFGQMLDQRFGPVNETIDGWRQQQNESWAASTVEATQKELGTSYEDDDLNPYVAAEMNAISQQYDLDQLTDQQKRSLGPQITKAAIEKLRTRDKQVSDKAVEAYKASLRGDGESATPYEPGVRGAALGNEAPPRDELDLVRRLNAQTQV